MFYEVLVNSSHALERTLFGVHIPDKQTSKSVHEMLGIFKLNGLVKFS